LIITCMPREMMRKYPQLIGRIPAAMQRTWSTKPRDNQRRVMTTSSKVRYCTRHPLWNTIVSELVPSERLHTWFCRDNITLLDHTNICNRLITVHDFLPSFASTRQIVAWCQFMISCPLATMRKMFLRVDWKPSIILDVFSHMTSWQEHEPANVISAMTSCGESMGLQRIFSDMTLYSKSMDLQRFSLTWHCMVKAWICKDFLWQFIVWRGHGPAKIFSDVTSYGWWDHGSGNIFSDMTSWQELGPCKELPVPSVWRRIRTKNCPFRLIQTLGFVLLCTTSDNQLMGKKWIDFVKIEFQFKWKYWVKWDATWINFNLIVLKFLNLIQISIIKNYCVCLCCSYLPIPSLTNYYLPNNMDIKRTHVMCLFMSVVSMLWSFWIVFVFVMWELEQQLNMIMNMIMRIEAPIQW
jgi:hypothetical protein